MGNRITRLRSTAAGTITGERHRYARTGNRLLETIDERTGRATAYRHGIGGAPLAIGPLAYTDDPYRRPVSVHRDGEPVATCAYNAFGERIRTTVHSGPDRHRASPGSCTTGTR